MQVCATSGQQMEKSLDRMDNKWKKVWTQWTTNGFISGHVQTKFNTVSTILAGSRSDLVHTTVVRPSVWAPSTDCTHSSLKA